jgi:hypothetical protein
VSIIVNQLSREDYERYPVWANYEEPGDFESILTWGEKGAQIVREIQAAGYSDAYYYPVLQLDDAWQGARGVTVRATIVAADGTELPGCVSAATSHYLGVFAGDEEFSFNIHWEDSANERLLQLRRATGRTLSPFFPLRYKTEFRISYGERVEGFFGYGDQVSQYLLREHNIDLRGHDTVRVVSLRWADREFDGDESIRRPPQVGDVATVMRCYDPAEHAAPIAVKCIDWNRLRIDWPLDYTYWFAEFAPEELELVSRDE